jgi:hypothetical protein
VNYKQTHVKTHEEEVRLPMTSTIIGFLRGLKNNIMPRIWIGKDSKEKSI